MDRHLQRNLIQLYKKEAEEHEIKKYLAKQKQIKEEKEYLNAREQRESEAEDRIRLDRIKKISENMDSYHKMLEHLPQRRKSRIEDVVINNYGYNVLGGTPVNHQCGDPKTTTKLIFNMNSVTSCPQNERDFIRRKNHVGNFLTENLNEGEINSYFLNQKNHQIKYYKEMLDTQCSKNQSPLESRAGLLNVQNTNIIKQYKRFALSDDPYNLKRNSPFGSSKLEYNPILNPVNNPGYNKYINISNSIPGHKQLSHESNQLPQLQLEKLQYNNNDINNRQHQPPSHAYHLQKSQSSLMAFSNRDNHIHLDQKQSNNYQYQNGTPNPYSVNGNKRLIQAGALAFNK